MLLFENENGYKKICIWKNEIPFDYIKHESLHFCVNSDNNTMWYNGTICVEARLGIYHVSNYAMVCMKYTADQDDKTDIIINYGNEETYFKSKIAPYNKNVCVGLYKEFADAIEEFFNEYLWKKLPCGTIEILGGCYDEIGSSNMAFKKVMKLLIFLFQYIDKLSNNELKYELLNIMQAPL